MSRRSNLNNNYRNTPNKKRKLNKVKLLKLVCLVGIFLFCIGKLSEVASGFIKDASNKKVSEQEMLTEDKQFDLGEELQNKEKKYTILVDPGHGGNDKGTQSKATGNYEKDISLQIAKKVASRLSKEKDVQVLISRTDDKYVSLSQRTSYANSENADILVSVHLNAEAGGNTASGVETYYRRGAVDGSDKLAKIVQETIVSYIDVRDRGIREDIFEVIREAKMPAILVECGFLTNPKEEKKLLKEKYQDQLAEGIAQGVLAFLDEKSK